MERRLQERFSDQAVARRFWALPMTAPFVPD